MSTRRSCITPTVLICDNDEWRLLESTYWDSEFCYGGLFYFSVNAGAIRMLVPDNVDHDCMEAMVTTQHVVVSKTRASLYEAMYEDDWADMPPAIRAGIKKEKRYEVMFEDGTDTPYAIWTGIGQWDRIIASFDHGREGLKFLAYGRGCRVLVEKECRFRVVERLPYLKPWKWSAQG